MTSTLHVFLKVHVAITTTATNPRVHHGVIIPSTNNPTHPIKNPINTHNINNSIMRLYQKQDDYDAREEQEKLCGWGISD
jgi:hypothetical protein